MKNLLLSFTAIVFTGAVLAGCTQTPVETTPADEVMIEDTDAMMTEEQMMEAEGDTMMDTEMSAGEVKEFTVEGSNMKFVPNTMTVNEGDTVRITFKNVEGFHDFVIDEFDVATEQFQAPGEEVVEFVADQSGTFEYYCSVGQHRQMGMVGTLVVEPTAN